MWVELIIMIFTISVLPTSPTSNILTGELSMPPSIHPSFSFSDLSPFYEHGPANHLSVTPPPVLSQTPIITSNPSSRPLVQQDLGKANHPLQTSPSPPPFPSRRDATKTVGSTVHSRAITFRSPPNSPIPNLPAPHSRGPRMSPYPPSGFKEGDTKTLGFASHSRGVTFRSPPSSSMAASHSESRNLHLPASRSKRDAAKSIRSTSHSRSVAFHSPPSLPILKLPAPDSRGVTPACDSDRSQSESPSLDESESGDTRLIPKPDGDAGRPGRGGYNLEVILGWKKKDFKSVKDYVKGLIEKHLDSSQNFSSQSLEALKVVRTMANDRFAFLLNYENCWPVSDIIRQQLKYTSGRARLEATRLDAEDARNMRRSRRR